MYSTFINRKYAKLFLIIFISLSFITWTSIQLFYLTSDSKDIHSNTNINENKIEELKPELAPELEPEPEPEPELEPEPEPVPVPEQIPPRPKPIHLHNNTAYGASTSPYDDFDFCNHIPNTHHYHDIYLPRPKDNKPIQIFSWKPTIFTGNRDWEKLSQTLCPFPLELQTFFDRYRTVKINNPSIQWETGYAPCFFWEGLNGTKTCNTKSIGKVTVSITTNFTNFKDADIIYLNDIFLYWVSNPPYYDPQLLPPRQSHQRWVNHFRLESIAHYPYVGMNEFQSLFDLSLGNPPHAMDIPENTYLVTKEMVQNMIDAEPHIPFEADPENYIAFFVSNCFPRNRRNELMQELMDGIGAHNYGQCKHNKDVPAGVEPYGPTWQTDKKNILIQYPYALAAENSNCKGYVTEKIYDILAIGVIPVYLGAEDIADYVPEGSYIDASEFDNTDDLIQFLKMVDRSQYYKWKEVVRKDPTKFCKKCLDTPPDAICSILDRITFV